jgi:hypothetical protein
MSTTDIVNVRHAKRGPMPAAVRDRIRDDRRAASQARRDGDRERAWRLLEETHVLAQPWAWPHLRSHLDMLRLAVATRDRHEVIGQLGRVLVAAPGSAMGRYPRGNTGRATVPATQPMPVPEELARLLDTV